MSVANVVENRYICRKVNNMDLLLVLLIAIGSAALALCFFPEAKNQKPKKREPLFKNWQPDDTGGLRWMGNRERARKQCKKKYFWDD